MIMKHGLYLHVKNKFYEITKFKKKIRCKSS